MNVPSTVSYRNLSSVIKGIADASGAAIPDVIDFEAGKTLEKCASLTTAASVEKITANADSREYGVHVTGYSPKRVGKGYRDRAQLYKYSNRYPDVVWNAILEQRAKSLARKLAHRGISKQSWLKLAQTAGLDIKVPGFVRKIALSIDKNFSSQRKRGVGSYSINFRNAQPTINRLGGQRIVKRAIQGRAKYFQKNMEMGVFAEIEKIAKAYPGVIKVNSPSGGKVME